MASTRLQHRLVWSGIRDVHLLCHHDRIIGAILDMGFHPDRVSATVQTANSVQYLRDIHLDPSDYCLATRY